MVDSNGKFHAFVSEYNSFTIFSLYFSFSQQTFYFYFFRLHCMNSGGWIRTSDLNGS